MLPPIARLYNFTIEETVALLGALANAGIHGSQAGSGLRQIFLELDKKGISLAEALKRVNESANPASTALELVGKRAAGALAIIANSQDVIQQLETDLYGAEGAANTLRRTFEDNLIGDFKKLKSAISEMAIVLGKSTDGPIRDFVQWMTEVVNGSEDTLGVVDSLARTFLFLEESILLAFKAAEEFWQFQQRNNPVGWVDQLFGGDGMLQGSVDRLNLIKKRLAEINGEIIKISDYGGVDSTSDGGGNRTSETTKEPIGINKTKSTNTVGSSSGVTKATDFGFAFSAFFDPGKIESDIGKVDGLLTKMESKFTDVSSGVKATGVEIGKSFDDIGLAASAASSLIGQFTASLLGPDASPLERAGVSIIGTLASIAVAAAVASATQSASATGPAAIFTLPTFIALGLGAVAAAMSGTGANISASPGGSRSAATATTTTPSSIQGIGQAGQLVATVRGQDLRFVLQGANDSYGALS